ncbi:diguanylate cyclase [Nocardia sp. ET3-3]|uniref:Diguanylate cyclase n=2 Tax=Nocardia terrae TaxID=2675851 RepID=A0A7K1UT49_9NOCA|nr:diguanylate cyclase [Nocardia terrae]
MSAPDAQRLLGDLIAELVAVLDSEPFDVDAAAKAGAALVDARLTSPVVLPVAARVLSGLSEFRTGPDVSARLAVVLTEFGRGYGAAVQQAQARGRLSIETAMAQARAAAQDRFRVVFDNAAVAIAVGDTTGRLVDANRAFADMIGTPIERLRGVSVYDFAHPDDRAGIQALVFEQLVPAGDGTVKLEQRIQRADGSYGWASFAITFVKGVGGQPDYLLTVGEDVTERHRMQEELHHQARHDPLTELPNRRHLIEQLDLAIDQAMAYDQVGLCFLDLDGFKQVNDHYGHGVGDRLLSAVAERLRAGLSEHGHLLARIGGDEFVALIPAADVDHVAAVAEQLLATLIDPITFDGTALQVSASIGAVVAPVAGADADALLDAADTALFRAKLDGKGRWVMHSHDLRADTPTNPLIRERRG